jgi:pimeloyl-ACP methyl ester carboxylesterase
MSRFAERWFKKRRWLFFIGCFALLTGMYQLLTYIYREEEMELRRQFRETVKETFPEQSDNFFRQFGLMPFESHLQKPDRKVFNQKSVVLIHGLDDPGKVWQNLAPTLVREGFNTYRMRYPNDQPIVESARLFFNELKGLKHLGAQQISIVAHSMGGLVSRELLTNPGINYFQSVKTGKVPKVSVLIMVGTPNHGSHLARLRVFSEIRDHFTRLRQGEADWLDTVLDGAGEAKIDLLPGSRFLTELNARPHPQGVEMLILAGITSPWSEKDIKRWMNSLHQKVSGGQEKLIDKIGNYMISMTHGLGDGLVTVESTRLDGVPHRLVEGTHLSMIRNITIESHRIPPAVPIIVDRLKSEDK